MAIDYKEIIVDGFLKLNEKQTIEDITIKQILETSKVSRQTFYNHFLDKNDLIQYVYDSRVVPNFKISESVVNFEQDLLQSFYMMKRYHRFMKQACMMEGQNNLKEHISQHCEEFDLQWHQQLYGEKEMPEALKFATIYHAHASSSMVFSWILSDMPVSCEEMAKMITNMRSIGMEELFKDGNFKGNPYK